MTLEEWIAIIAGLVVGWAAVSFIWRHQAGQPPPHARQGDALDLDRAEIEQNWSSILGVEANAPKEEIEAAFREKVASLRKQKPKIMTWGEISRFDLGEEGLRYAYKAAIRDRHNSDGCTETASREVGGAKLGG